MNITMTPEQIETARQRLVQELESIQGAQGLAGANAATVALDQSSVGRLSRMDAMQQQAMASSQKLRLNVRQRRVAAALQRLEDGEFGACCQCAEAISPERLAADAAAPFCADCQEEFDERRRSA